MNIAFFGKSMENIRDRVNLEFISHSETQQIIYTQCKLCFKNIVDRYENFGMYKYDGETIIFDEPIYLGFGVLELSKVLMFEFHFNTLKPYWRDRVHLHYMDTDSFVLSSIQTMKN